ncbi:MAG: hypothetical protein JHC39_11555 [Lentimicrobium sp.]|nr:hypothetical protein [Lentimicrobium sp.]
MIITGTYNLTADPEWASLPLQLVYLECDTTTAPVIINLFEIKDLNRFWNVQIFVIDQNKNADVNSITANVGGLDRINSVGINSIVLNLKGGSIELTPANDSSWVGSVSGLSGNPIVLKSNGTVLTPQLSSLNFTGAGVTTFALGNDVTVNINGATNSNFVFTQIIPATVWVVNHNLNKRCAVQVIDNTFTEVEAEILWNDNNTVTVTFNSNSTGYVYCN